MITDLNNNSLTRQITARVEFLEGSTQIAEYTSGDRVINFTIERVGEHSKFFGFGVCQQLNLHLIDKNRELNYGTNNSIKCYFNCDKWVGEVDGFPAFKITEVHRDENTNELSITAYDALYEATNHTVAELNLQAPYTVLSVVRACAQLLGTTHSIEIPGLNLFNDNFQLEYSNGANFDGAETIREVLDDIAELTQTVYYINSKGRLTFKQLDADNAPVLTIGKADYFSLNSKTNRRLSDVCSATELGDNVITESGLIGTVQYFRDNAFLELREDVTDILNTIIGKWGGLTINQFDCNWRGNPALEIADKIALVTKDDETVSSYVFDDVIEYDGSLRQRTQWSYSDSGESADNPVSLGDALKKTYAKVDKANQQIEIVAGETAKIKLDADSVLATVKQMDESMNNALKEVSAKVSAEDVSIAIQAAMEQGVEAVTTTTGFTFNEDGLHVSRTGSEITTTITEDGMTVLREDNPVLVADNLGVKAEDLHATTFLIIGNNSRLEDYDGNRTGCFYIGKI